MTESLWLAQQAWADMVALASARYPLETGGMLLGYRPEAGDVVATAIIGPGPKARHRRLRFAPDHAYQQDMLEAHFWRTDGTETYLGDWHTHPNGAAALSWLDKRVLARIARTSSSDTPEPVMVVLAGQDEDWQVCAIRYRSQTRRFGWTNYHLHSLTARIYSTPLSSDRTATMRKISATTTAKKKQGVR